MTSRLPSTTPNASTLWTALEIANRTWLWSCGGAHYPRILTQQTGVRRLAEFTNHSLMIALVCTLGELLAIRAINPVIRDKLKVDDVEHALNVTGGSTRALAYWALDSNKAP